MAQPAIGALPPGEEQTVLSDGSTVAGSSRQQGHILPRQRPNKSWVLLLAEIEDKFFVVINLLLLIWLT